MVGQVNFALVLSNLWNKHCPTQTNGWMPRVSRTGPIYQRSSQVETHIIVARGVQMVPPSHSERAHLVVNVSDESRILSWSAQEPVAFRRPKHPRQRWWPSPLRFPCRCSALGALAASPSLAPPVDPSLRRNPSCPWRPSTSRGPPASPRPSPAWRSKGRWAPEILLRLWYRSCSAVSCFFFSWSIVCSKSHI